MLRHGGHALLAMSCVVSVTSAVRAETPTHVLPPAAESVLRSALTNSAAPMKSGPGLAQVALDKDHVTLVFGSAKAPVATVTLRHPTVTEGAVASVPAFSLHGSDVPSATLSWLTSRLNKVQLSAVWRTVTPEVVTPPPGAGVRSHVEPADPQGLVAALHAAREAIRVGRPDSVRPTMQPFVKMRDTLSVPARIDIGAVLWQAGERDKARWMAASIIQGRDGKSLGWQAGILRGERPTLQVLQGSLGKADNPCEGLDIAEMLMLTEQTEVAWGLVAHLATLDPPCPQAQVRQVRRLLDTGQVEGADALSKTALAGHPDVVELIGVRARVLIAGGRPKDAAALLEGHAFEDPKRVSLSSLLGAYNRVESITWKRTKMDEMAARAKADPGNHLAAFIAGVLFHYDGRLAESDALLNPLVDTSLNDQARLYIYLGMNAFDLGDPTKGLAYVEQAARDKHPDPDVHYCRAEILRMTDPTAARDALNEYIAQTDHSATKNSAKQGRVATLLTNLERCVAEGQTTPCPGPWEHPRGEGVSLFDYRTSQPVPGWAIPAGLLALLLTGLGLWTRRRRRQT